MPTNRYTVERADPHVRINIWPETGRMAGNPPAYIIVTDWAFLDELERENVPKEVCDEVRKLMQEMDELPF